MRAHLGLCYANGYMSGWDASTVAEFASNVAFVNMWHGFGKFASGSSEMLTTESSLGFPDAVIFEAIHVGCGRRMGGSCAMC